MFYKSFYNFVASLFKIHYELLLKLGPTHPHMIVDENITSSFKNKELGCHFPPTYGHSDCILKTQQLIENF